MIRELEDQCRQPHLHTIMEHGMHIQGVLQPPQPTCWRYNAAEGVVRLGLSWRQVPARRRMRVDGARLQPVCSENLSLQRTDQLPTASQGSRSGIIGREPALIATARSQQALFANFQC